MSDPLYKKPLLRLAADACGAGRLAAPHCSGTAHNPSCGDKVTADLILEDARIAGLALETKACVLAQASASILGADAVGLNRDEIEALRRQVIVLLEGGARPEAPFDVYEHFSGVADHAARHRCVLLPIEAVLLAFDAQAERR